MISPGAFITGLLLALVAGAVVGVVGCLGGACLIWRVMKGKPPLPPPPSPGRVVDALLGRRTRPVQDDPTADPKASRPPPPELRT